MPCVGCPTTSILYLDLSTETFISNITSNRLATVFDSIITLFRFIHYNIFIGSCFLSLSGLSGHILVGNEFDYVQSYHLLLPKPKVKHTFHGFCGQTSFWFRTFPLSLPFLSLLYRFRSGFRHAFAWCPFIKVSEEDKMELQHAHTFRVTMTRSNRTNSTHAHASIKTSSTFDTNMAVSTQLYTERDACIQLKKYTSTNTFSTHKHVANSQDDIKSAAAILIDNTH